MKATRIDYQPVLGGRIGTAVCPVATLIRLFGEPRRDGGFRDYDENKVTVTWTFKTPRGLAELRDYWWNGKTEWTIAAQNRKPAMYLARTLRKAGIPASTRFHDSTQAKPFNAKG